VGPSQRVLELRTVGEDRVRLPQRIERALSVGRKPALPAIQCFGESCLVRPDNRRHRVAPDRRQVPFVAGERAEHERYPVVGA